MGYPDYQAYGNWRGASYFNGPAAYTSVGAFFFSAIATNWNALRVFASNPSIGCTVTITFFTDSSETHVLQQLSYTLAAGVLLDVTMPIAGNFFQVEISTGQAGSGTVALVIAPSNMPVPRPMFNDNGAFTGGVFINVNAGATLNAMIDIAVQGQGFISFTTSATTAVFTVTVVSLGENGSALFAITASEKILSLNGPIFFTPAAGLQLQITNNDTVAHTVNYYMQVLSQ